MLHQKLWKKKDRMKAIDVQMWHMTCDCVSSNFLPPLTQSMRATRCYLVVKLINELSGISQLYIKSVFLLLKIFID
jgi:hypothetical protein